MRNTGILLAFILSLVTSTDPVHAQAGTSLTGADTARTVNSTADFGRGVPSRPLAGALSDLDAWRTYKRRFVSDQGRVIDTANGGISHSEGQGYGMLLAVAAGDHETFDAIWGWTRANLMVRDDNLLAWRWEPDQRPAVADMNDASDGDILVAWALTEAAEAWHDAGYKVAARRIAVDIGHKLIIPQSAHGMILLPGVSGFASEDRTDGPVINLSYWVFPAFARLPLAAPDVDWAELSRNGLALIKQSQFGPARLPAEWVSLHGQEPKPADGFVKSFSYNAIRIPLYVAWAGLGQHDLYSPFLAAWHTLRNGGLPVIDTATGQPVEWFVDKGYTAISSLASCAADHTSFSAEGREIQANESYYAVTLNLLALVAGHMRYSSCLDR